MKSVCLVLLAVVTFCVVDTDAQRNNVLIRRKDKKDHLTDLVACPSKSGHHSIHDYLKSDKRPPPDHPLMDPTSIQMMIDGRSDRLTINKITCMKTATGITTVTKGIFGAFGAAIAAGVIVAGEGAVVVGTGGAAVGILPVTATAVASAAAGGASAAVKITEFLDETFGSSDDFYLTVNGIHIIPLGRKYVDLNEDDILNVDVSFPIPGGARIELFDYDTVSHDDSLGIIDVNPNVSPDKTYYVPGALAWSSSEGSYYQIDYTVTRNPTTDLVQYLYCGANFCKLCVNVGCDGDNTDGLEKDKDLEDLKSCPPSFKTFGTRRFEKPWPLADQFLRICQSI